MNEKEYPTLFKTVGAFDIFKSQYYHGCYVRALANKTDHDRVKMLSHCLVDLNDVRFRQTQDDIRYHAIRRRNISDKRAKQTYYEVALETGLKPEEVEVWLLANALSVPLIEPVKEEFSVERMSVGPCRYFGKETQYIKIRFDGYSVPLHFTTGLGSGKLEGKWDETETAKAVKEELPNDPGTVDEIMNMFRSGSTANELVQRALAKPMNKSKIVESGSFSPTFFVPKTIKARIIEDGQYWVTKPIADLVGYKAVKEKNELAAPGLNPVAVFSFTCQPTKDKYGYNQHTSMMVIVCGDDKVYTVPRIFSWYGQDDNKQLHATNDLRNIAKEAVIKASDMVPLDEMDAFVRERAGRALSRKL